MFDIILKSNHEKHLDTVFSFQFQCVWRCIRFFEDLHGPFIRARAGLQTENEKRNDNSVVESSTVQGGPHRNAAPAQFHLRGTAYAPTSASLLWTGEVSIVSSLLTSHLDKTSSLNFYSGKNK